MYEDINTKAEMCLFTNARTIIMQEMQEIS